MNFEIPPALGKKVSERSILSRDRRLLWEEPVDVAAMVADEAGGGGVGPIDVEEGGDGGVELGFATVKFVVGTDLAFQDVALNLVGFGFGFGKEWHGSRMIGACG